ncbi:c-type cytochrome [Geomonas subterranea]|uniref:Cytochrome c n=1 Tax=Geomonas subterranea TaxID=2847989 RepID=A0ABX8LGY5_9BACT|nr:MULTISPECIES: cytochrome c [Geomonas]QXE91295.1 cytochrome c [Geomonas subterranea]QXM10618.1 cytochrome c [Geomonas subterranea]
MKKTILSIAAALSLAAFTTPAPAAPGPPRMPYAFEMYCVMCHQQGVQIGPTGIFDMQSKSGNPLHEQYIRNNVRFGMKAMPAFRLSEVPPKELDGFVAYLKDVAAYRKTNPTYRPVPAQKGGAKK